MLEHPYYIVYKMVERKNTKYPFFVTCALIKDKGFYRIDNLEQYLYDGSGVSNEYIAATSGYSLIKDQNFNFNNLTNI